MGGSRGARRCRPASRPSRPRPCRGRARPRRAHDAVGRVDTETVAQRAATAVSLSGSGERPQAVVGQRPVSGTSRSHVAPDPRICRALATTALIVRGHRSSRIVGLVSVPSATSRCASWSAMPSRAGPAPPSAIQRSIATISSSVGRRSNLPESQRLCAAAHVVTRSRTRSISIRASRDVSRSVKVRTSTTSSPPGVPTERSAGAASSAGSRRTGHPRGCREQRRRAAVRCGVCVLRWRRL